MARVLDTEYPSWLHAFRDWTVPRSEAPESFIMWAGLYTLSSVLKRHVRFPKRLLGSYDIFPNLFIIFVGPPGGPRKTTTANYAKTLLHQVENVEVASTATSVSKLINVMQDNTIDGALSIVSSEFGSFVNVSQEEMYDYLTDVFDNPDQYRYDTRMHGTEVVKTPTINLLAATTPSWINEQMPTYVIGGGFSSRCIFIYEPAPRRRKMYYDEVDSSHIELLQNALVNDLEHIMANVEGSFRHESPEVRQAMEDWYVHFVDNVATDERLESYMSRKHVHVHKVAMLLSVAESDDLVITMDHFEAAKEILGRIEQKMPRIFSSVGKNPHSSDLQRVLEAIQQKGEVSYSSLVSRFYHDIQPEKLSEILNALRVMGDINREKDTDGNWIFFPA